MLAVTRLRQILVCWHSVSLVTAPAFAAATTHVTPHPAKCRLWVSVVSTSPVQPEGLLRTCVQVLGPHFDLVVDRFGHGDRVHEPADLPLCIANLFPSVFCVPRT